MATVRHAVKLLTSLAQEPGGVGTNELARRTGLNVSTVSRLLATLAEDEMVHRVAGGGGYRLGPLLVELGNAALSGLDLRDLTHPHLVALTEATGETSSLSIPAEQGMFTVDFVQSPSSVRSVAQIGRPSVPHATATGKILLAHRGTIPEELPSYTEHTITDPKALANEVEQAMKRGWAQAVGEREDDLNAIAAAINGPGGELVGVLGLQGPAFRFGLRAMRSAAPALLEAAGRISSHHLGVRGTPS